MVRITRLAALGIAAIMLTAAAVSPADARVKFKTLLTFCNQRVCFRSNGSHPAFGLVQDSSGLFYGVTEAGGTYGGGEVFQSTGVAGDDAPPLYEFCVTRQTGACTDGPVPGGPVILDKQGNVYGVTVSGGAYGYGTLFELRAKQTKNGTIWKHVTLHDFCSDAQAYCPDGVFPAGGLTYKGADTGAPFDGVSPLYGVATQAGNINSGGVVFQLDPPQGKKGAWTYKVVYSFCTAQICPDGKEPHGILMTGNGIHTKLELYGVTRIGGEQVQGAGAGEGTLFQIEPSTGTETVIYRFCQQSNCADGAYPQVAPAVDGNGALVGVTLQGGVNEYGVLYRIDPSLDSPETVLYDFCRKPSCSDGAFPLGGAVIAPNGDIFGTTTYGGRYDTTDSDSTGLGCGIVFQFSNRDGSEKILHSFCKGGRPGCLDGAEPNSIYLDARGILYGTTHVGGDAGAKDDVGVLFRLEP